MRRSFRAVLLIAIAAITGTALSACGVQEEFQRGYVIDERVINQVKIGSDGNFVLQTLGTPSTVSTVGNQTWYYISQTATRSVQFMPDKIVDQRVTAIYFNKSLKVERIAIYGLQDGKIFDFISRSTPTSGGDQSFVRQLFKGVGRFNPFGA
jgi:outer membrane protein assembly factor BamE (lipoprotein component of BamABCDE complex)